MHAAWENISNMTFSMIYGHYECVKTPIALSNAQITSVNTM